MDDIKELISTFLGDSLTNLLKSGTDRITNEISQIVNNRILEYLVAEYNSNYKTKTLIYKVEPIELEKFYQPLHLRRMKLELLHSPKTDSDNRRIETRCIKNLFNDDKNCITIIGTAGAGKSTLVKYLIVDCIRNKYKIPVKVELRYLNKYNDDLLVYISDKIIKFNKIAEKDNIVEKLLNSGKFIFIFDGYDEVKSDRKESIIHDISVITKRYNKNNYILTSRPYVNVEMLDNFYNYEICDLEPDEINSFIRKQFSDSEQEMAVNIIDTINNKTNNNDAYKSFLKNPLLLSMFIIACEKDIYIPENKSDFYRNVFDALYSGHDTLAKIGYEREQKSGLSKEDIINLLKQFSFKSFFEEKYFFTQQYYENKINIYKAKVGLDFNNDFLLDDLKVAIGILKEEGKYITYPHKSLQEYFAALFVTSLTHDNKIKFYNSLKNKIQTEFRSHADYSNFFSLLKEMDKINYQKQIVIPLLKYIKNRIIKPEIFRMNDAELLKGETSGYIDVMIIYTFTHINEREMMIEYVSLIIDFIHKMKKWVFNDGINIKNIDLTKQYEKMVSTSFLNKYNLDDIISKIEKEIDNTEKNETAFLEDFI